MVFAKQKLDALKKKNGIELMEELNLIPKTHEDNIKELLDKKRDMAIKGSFKLPRLRTTASKNKRNTELKQNISTVQEDEDEECKSSDSIDVTSQSISCFETPGKSDRPSLTKDNLNRMSLKQDRSNFQGSLIGNLMKTIHPPSAAYSQIDMRASPRISCGKMFMLSDRLSFIGTSSMLGQSFSTVHSMLSSMNDTQSQFISDFDDMSLR